VLLPDKINQAQELLLRVERECSKVCLGLNTKKTKTLTFNINDPEPLRTTDGIELEYQDDVSTFSKF